MKTLAGLIGVCFLLAGCVSQTELKKAQDENTQLKQQHAQAVEDINKLNSDLAASKANVTKAQADAKTANDQVQKLNGDLAKAKDDLTKAQSAAGDVTKAQDAAKAAEASVKSVVRIRFVCIVS